MMMKMEIEKLIKELIAKLKFHIERCGCEGVDVTSDSHFPFIKIHSNHSDSFLDPSQAIEALEKISELQDGDFIGVWKIVSEYPTEVYKGKLAYFKHVLPVEKNNKRHQSGAQGSSSNRCTSYSFSVTGVTENRKCYHPLHHALNQNRGALFSKLLKVRPSPWMNEFRRIYSSRNTEALSSNVAHEVIRGSSYKCYSSIKHIESESPIEIMEVKK